MTRIVVVYDVGAADLREIQTGLSRLGTVAYALPEPVDSRLAALVGQFGEVVALPDVDRLRPDAVLTFSERQLRRTAALTDRLGLPGHTPATAVLLTDKRAQRARLTAADVDRVRSAVVHGPQDWAEAVAAVGLPAVLKPVRGEGSSRTYLIDSAADVPLAGDGPFVLEEFLVGRDATPFGDYVSVESVVAHGQVSHLAVTGKFPLLPPFRERGHFWPAVLHDGEHERILDLTGRALRALGVRTGLAHTEIKLTPDGPRLIEVNGRLGGFVNELSIRAAGVDLVELAGRAALGEPAGVDPVRPDRVHFLHNHPSPPFGYRLREVRGVAEARRVPGITGYRRVVPPNATMDADVMTRPMDALAGEAAGHEHMGQVLTHARRCLTFVFEVGGELIEIPGDALP
ncbi:hypothetical protein AB0C02_27470 [Micromonospora sp. NPDC048999]|uniref:ATP-grasp domain-containing protein n=1 Tax=Micromonospora sp. NPDC048999 TaxID=3155391 RepID=UPI0033F15A95